MRSYEIKKLISNIILTGILFGNFSYVSSFSLSPFMRSEDPKKVSNNSYA